MACRCMGPFIWKVCRDLLADALSLRGDMSMVLGGVMFGKCLNGGGMNQCDHIAPTQDDENP